MNVGLLGKAEEEYDWEGRDEGKKGRREGKKVKKGGNEGRRKVNGQRMGLGVRKVKS